MAKRRGPATRDLFGSAPLSAVADPLPNVDPPLPCPPTIDSSDPQRAAAKAKAISGPETRPLDSPEPVQDLKAPSAETLHLLREAAAESMVLLSNDGVLPLTLESLTRVAVIGPHAIAPSVMGGGSAQVTPYPLTTPLEALWVRCGTDVEIVFERGCEISTAPSVVGEAVLRAPDGFVAEKFAGRDFEGPMVETLELSGLRMVSFGSQMSKEEIETIRTYVIHRATQTKSQAN